MRTFFISSLLVISLTGSAFGQSLQPRSIPMHPVPKCRGQIPTSITDPGFAGGNSSVYGLEGPTGSLKLSYKYANSGYGVTADSSNNAAFTFQVTEGTGTFALSQTLCMVPSQAYDLRYYVGLTAPDANTSVVSALSSNGDCTHNFLFNDRAVGRTDLICGPNDVNPPSKWGLYTTASFNNRTQYQTAGTFYQPRQEVNKVAISFNCTAAQRGSNLQISLDGFTTYGLYGT